MRNYTYSNGPAAIFSAVNLPEFVIEEVALYLTVSESHRAMAGACRRWYRIFLVSSDMLTNRRICFIEFGCDPILPPRCSWNNWIEQLRTLLVYFGGPTSGGLGGGTSTQEATSSNQLVLRGHHPRFVLFPPHPHPQNPQHPGQHHFWHPRRSLHSGSVVLPPDFRYRFSSDYSSPSYVADLQRIIEARRSEITHELGLLFTQHGHEGFHGAGVGVGSDDGHRREMIEKVICLRTLASEQIELEVICIRHAHGLSLRRAREIDLAYRRHQTLSARRELTRIRDYLERALLDSSRSRGGEQQHATSSTADLVTAISVADDKMLSLLPPSDMMGNDMARCLELRKVCRGLIEKLETEVERAYASGIGSAAVTDLDDVADDQALSLSPLALGRRKRKRLMIRSAADAAAAVERELEEIKQTTVARLEALLGHHRAGILGDGDTSEGRRIGAQIEMSLLDVAHWKERDASNCLLIGAAR